LTCKPRVKPAAYVLLGGFSLSIGQLAAAPLALQQQVVTATRTAQTAEQSLASVTVIDRERIEQSQATSLPELLKRVPGVSLTNNGGPGKATSLFLRGTESDHVLVMIDGIKIGSVTGGGAALQDLPLELIERIEAVRGPRSSLYGSEAIGGVIQIFTRRGQAQGAKPYFSAGYGTHDSYTGSVFAPDEGSMARWRGWWRIVRVDQWGVFFCGAMLGMILPAILYTATIAAPGERKSAVQMLMTRPIHDVERRLVADGAADRLRRRRSRRSWPLLRAR